MYNIALVLYLLKLIFLVFLISITVSTIVPNKNLKYYFYFITANTGSVSHWPIHNVSTTMFYSFSLCT